MGTAPDDRDLVGLIGAPAARALDRWAAQTGRTVAPTRQPWTASGYTGAVLTTLVVTEPGQPARKVVLKVCPPGRYTAESGAHRRALADSPAGFVRAHLIGQVYDPYPVDGGGLLMFQQVAGGSLAEMLPLDALAGEDLVAACRQVITGTLARWNTVPLRTAVRSAPDYLGQELGWVTEGGGTLARWAASVRVDSSPGGRPWLMFPGYLAPLPNPLLLHHPRSLLAGVELDVLLGRAHGDLHTQNVLIPRDHARLRPDRFRLVDLSTFEAEAPLTRDPATLLLSLLAPRLALTGGPARLALADHLVAAGSDRGPLPGEVSAVVGAVTGAADREVRRNGWVDEWRAQFLLSLVAAGLAFVTFERLPAADRWWYFMLSARAAQEFLRLHGRAAPPDDPAAGPLVLPAADEPPSAPVPPTQDAPTQPATGQPQATQARIDPAPATQASLPRRPPPARPLPARVRFERKADSGRARPASLGPQAPDALTQLVEALLDCASLETGRQRDLIVSGLPRDMRTAIRRYDETRADVISIVRTCARYRGGLRDLLAAVRQVEVGTIAIDRLAEIADGLLREIESEDG